MMITLVLLLYIKYYATSINKPFPTTTGNQSSMQFQFPPFNVKENNHSSLSNTGKGRKSSHNNGKCNFFFFLEDMHGVLYSLLKPFLSGWVYAKYLFA